MAGQYLRQTFVDVQLDDRRHEGLVVGRSHLCRELEIGLVLYGLDDLEHMLNEQQRVRSNRVGSAPDRK